MTLDQIHAYHPSGKLHSSSPDYPGFEETMRRQGFRTVRIPAEQCQGDWLRSRPVVAVPETEATPQLPSLGDWVTTPLLGLLRVSHFVTLADEPCPLPVGVGSKGTGLIRADGWQPAAPPSAPEPVPPLAPEPSVSSCPAPAHQPSLFDFMEV